MIDFHAHVLPGVDDGSADVEESIALLQMLREQGVDRVIATPHFDPRGDTPVEFLNRRDKAHDELVLQGESLDLPTVIDGAEISYFYGVSRMKRLSDLRISGTRLLLIEMPMSEWSDATVKELVELAAYRDFVPVIAHVERYFKCVHKSVIRRLTDNGVLMQINASFVNDRRTRRKALRMIKGGQVHFLGSDCHGIAFRAPKIGDAAKIIRTRLGDGFFALSERMLEKYKI